MGIGVGFKMAGFADTAFLSRCKAPANAPSRMVGVVVSASGFGQLVTRMSHQATKTHNLQLANGASAFIAHYAPQVGQIPKTPSRDFA